MGGAEEGEREGKREGENGLERPVVGVGDHRHQHRDDFVLFGVERSTNLGFEVAAAHRELDPRRRLGRFTLGVAELRDERRRVATFAPSLGDASTHRARGAPTLIRERRALLGGKFPAQLK